jgi:predicted Rossmann fold flavoprotein
MLYDVLIIGAGASGLMCALTAGQNGKKALVLEHSHKIGEKIRISGGGRCNFTNIHTQFNNFLSGNQHFCKSALSRYMPKDFITLLDKHNISYHEKKLGQLFCDNSAKDILNMFQQECEDNNIHIRTDVHIHSVQKQEENFEVILENGKSYFAKKLVIATGGLSIPKIGATDFGYRIAKQFSIKMTQTRAGLVPLTFANEILSLCQSLAGVAVDAEISWKNIKFREGMLFTHRGLSGPSILQISSYWRESTPITINLLPDMDLYLWLKEQRNLHPKQEIHNILSGLLPKNLLLAILDNSKIIGRIADLSDKKLQSLSDFFQRWQIIPTGTEGYRTAEVTLGGVDTNEISSQTMESKKVAGLYFIGEVLDVTGHLGGFNFQWAWASGYVAGMDI